MPAPPLVGSPIEQSASRRSHPAALPDEGQRTYPSGELAAKSSLLDHRWFVLGAIFLAMMFLGLPLLWRCPNFSRLEKAVWTLIVLVYSAVIIWLFILVMSWSYQRIADTLTH